VDRREKKGCGEGGDGTTKTPAQKKSTVLRWECSGDRAQLLLERKKQKNNKSSCKGKDGKEDQE